MNTTTTSQLATAERSAEGWLIVDFQRVNDDPHRYDDCWHRGEFTRYTVRGTSLVFDEQLSDGIGDLYNRVMDTLANDLGYVGTVEFMGTGLPYRRILGTECHTHEWLTKRAVELAEETAEYAGEPDDIGECDGWHL